MKEPEDSLASETEVNNVLYLGDKNNYKKMEKFRRYNSNYFFGISHIEHDVGHKII